ncbi:MAG: hypothetical protein JXA94_07265 [Parachlamydiales bacterium]|nr:hypothetical protein [Parachlamydiales bacterium]
MKWILKNVKPVQNKIEVLQKKAMIITKNLNNKMKRHTLESRFLVSLAFDSLLFYKKVSKKLSICKEIGRSMGIFDAHSKGVFVQNVKGNCRVIYCS